MSRGTRKQLLSMAETLDDANRLMKKLFLKPAADEEAVVELLSDCQDAAVALGNRIEALQGEGTETVKELEDYCEDLYRLALLAGDMKGRREISKMLTVRVKKIRNLMEAELSDKREVVFLPYKASMWDSLESVWMAADADDECDVYVIPIPYFDKNPDGSFGKIHYEGELYPDYVPVTRYDAYDFEMRRPDMIFIHNPYDNCNTVTSVEPYFYTDNLKNFTENLVYIPYFILGEIDPDDQEQVERMRHFCILPGTVNADKVIVESEKIRQIYINEFLRTAEAQNVRLDARALEKKILGLGSPKFDKVLNTRVEDLSIPEEWVKVIQKPNGSRKKVIFYNTTISAVLKNDTALSKMERVLNDFKKYKDEIALLWRPHPLLESTMASMRPQLLEKYKELRNRYIREGWGIYDDTADMDRALVLSDGYYGDGGSLVHLYIQMDKPIMIANYREME